MIIGASSHDIPAKCFNFKTGTVIQEFNRLQRSCFTLDVARDCSLAAFGDYNGNLQIENLQFQ
jgi:hypothetical protein